MSCDKKVAFLCLEHKNAAQLNRLHATLQHPLVDIYVHLDAKSVGLRDAIRGFENLTLLSEEDSYDVRWSQFQACEAVVALISEANISGEDYKYFYLISGQDYPIRTMDSLLELLLSDDCEADFINVSPPWGTVSLRAQLYWPQALLGKRAAQRAVSSLYRGVGKRLLSLGFPARRRPKNINRFYYGSQWWCIRSECAYWIADQVNRDSSILRFFKNVQCSDECFFQSMYMASPFAGECGENLTYIDWSQGGSSPKMLCDESDFAEIMQAEGKFFARKFEMPASADLMDRLDALAREQENRDFSQEERMNIAFPTY